MVVVNTVVLVQAVFGMTQAATALALGAYGAGSMIAALPLPRLLESRAGGPPPAPVVAPGGFSRRSSRLPTSAGS